MDFFAFTENFTPPMFISTKGFPIASAATAAPLAFQGDQKTLSTHRVQEWYERTIGEQGTLARITVGGVLAFDTGSDVQKGKAQKLVH